MHVAASERGSEATRIAVSDARMAERVPGAYGETEAWYPVRNGRRPYKRTPGAHNTGCR